VRGVCAFLITQAASLGKQKLSSTLSLKSSRCPFFIITKKVTHFVANSAFPFSFLFFSLENHVGRSSFRIILLVVDISSLVHIVFIFYFYSWLYCKIFICFQFHPSIPICYAFYFQYDSYSFDF